MGAVPIRRRVRLTRRQRLANSLFATGIILLAVVWTFTFRPQRLGGPVAYVMIEGVSMLPTFHSGDLVIVRRGDTYEPGQVVAYRVPQGEFGAGVVIVHRIVGGSSQDGFLLQGDNNPDPDEWRPTDRDIMGSVWLVAPRLGAALSFLHAPLPLASLATGAAVAIVLTTGARVASTPRRAGRIRGSDAGSPSRYRRGRAPVVRQRQPTQEPGSIMAGPEDASPK
jgi:signal peptidase I